LFSVLDPSSLGSVKRVCNAMILGAADERSFSRVSVEYFIFGLGRPAATAGIKVTALVPFCGPWRYSLGSSVRRLFRDVVGAGRERNEST
jgi:hypothetical protein